MKSNVFDEACGALRTRPAHGGEYPGADGPVFTIDLGIIRERWLLIEIKVGKALLHAIDLRKQFFVGHGLGLCQNGRQVVIVARLDSRNETCVDILLVLEKDGIIHGAKR